jgi:hypothetical protein
VGFKKFIEHFQHYPDLPVQPSLVADWIKAEGYQDEIYFVELDLDTTIIRGMVTIFNETQASVPYAEPVSVATIYYSKNMDKKWQNLSCMKELFHCFNIKWVTDDAEKLEQLANQLALPTRAQYLELLMKQDEHVRYDRFGELYGLAIAFPMLHRQELMPPYKAGVLTVEDISNLANVPAPFARLVMSDGWEQIYRDMLNSLD